MFERSIFIFFLNGLVDGGGENDRKVNRQSITTLINY
jgi:hypothetical protein